MENKLHEGHRNRLKNRFLNEGLDNFEMHNVIELLLFFAIPVKDVNPIAHALINEFGSLDKIFDADFDSLCEVKGVSEHTATLLTLMPSLFKKYSQCKFKSQDIFLNEETFLKLVVSNSAPETEECVWLYLFDNANRLIFYEMIFTGSVNSVKFDTKKAVELILKKKASSIVLVHNHPNGTAYPSSTDINTTTELFRVFNALGIDLEEHYVVSANKVYPIIKKGNVITVNI